MLRFDDFGPAERLHAAIRRRVPQLAASIVLDQDTGLSRVRVTYRHAGPRVADWDGTTYRWRHGDGAFEPLPRKGGAVLRRPGVDLCAMQNDVLQIWRTGWFGP